MASGEVIEIILALSTTMEGDTTNFYIFRKLKGFQKVRISTLARSVSIGTTNWNTDEITLGRSLVNRIPTKIRWEDKFCIRFCLFFRYPKGMPTFEHLCLNCVWIYRSLSSTTMSNIFWNSVCTLCSGAARNVSIEVFVVDNSG
ncbi:MAG: hypothetical protein R3E08_10520 [Thiotrichaceae bacterium]